MTNLHRARSDMRAAPLRRVTLFAVLAVISKLACAEDQPLKTVGHVDLGSYQGKWYEIGRLPLSWENKCASDVTASYYLKGDGGVAVLNSCRKADGKLTESRGSAERRSGDLSGAKLRVTFFWPIAADYWVLQLDPSYQWALVGTPNRKYLWILSRMKTLDQSMIAQLLHAAKSDGFDVSRFLLTRQN
jgi:apolipoprotein D and lipocalin family protein